MVQLSLCIPTFNRSPELTELLESIIKQDRQDIEIVVADDCSTDSTEVVCSNYARSHGNFHYFKNPLNLGLDRNFLAVVEQASSRFVWLLGDDDRLEPNAIDIVLHAIDSHPGISGITVGVIDYDRSMKHVTGLRAMPSTGIRTSTQELFRSAVSLLGFMSAMIVNRERWIVVCTNDPVFKYANYYIQVYVTARVMDRFGKWLILRQPCVGFRSDNDQFLSSMGWLKRIHVDIAGYNDIAQAVFYDKPGTAWRIRRDVFRCHVVSRLRNAKLSESQPDYRAVFRYLIRSSWDIPEFWTKAIPTLLIPRALLRIVKVLYQKHSPSSGANRARSVSGAFD